MRDENVDWRLFLILLFLGWFGIDKLYKTPSQPKKPWKLFLLKFLANLIFIGEIWNLTDLIMCLVRYYRYNPLEYLVLIEERHNR